MRCLQTLLVGEAVGGCEVFSNSSCKYGGIGGGEVSSNSSSN